MDPITKNTVEIFNKYAIQYSEKFGDVTLYKDSLEIFCKELPTMARILELGCGPGNITRWLLSHRSDLKISGTDLAPKMLETAKQLNPEADFQIMDCRDLKILGAQFDGIMASFIFPYLTRDEAINLITSISESLNMGGIFYLSTMEDMNSRSGLRTSSKGETMYMNYHEAGYLIEAIEENGMQLKSTNRKQYTDHNGENVTDLILIAQKK